MAHTIPVTKSLWHNRHDVLLVRVVTIATIVLVWEGVARSGVLYSDVVPTLSAIAGGFLRVITHPDLAMHTSVTLFELIAAMAIGSGLGVLCGLWIGTNRLAARLLEPAIYYLGPTPKIIILPVLIMLFGIGSGSKIALGTMSSFFPVALSVAAGIRGINPILIRVGRSFNMNRLQFVAKIYIPAMRGTLFNALRLAFGMCVIGILLGETKFAQRGLGFMITTYFQRFDMPALYALALMIFAFAIGINTLIGKSEQRSRRPQ